jgi:AmiR/NasT family two-component response regulator
MRSIWNGRARWRVAILDGDAASRAMLRAAVEDAGGVVAVEAPLRLDAIAVLKETGADVVIMAPSLAAGQERTLMPHITAVLDCPAVLFTRDTERAMVRQAKRAGVMGFMLKPLRAAELAPTLELALARFRELRRLQQARTERPLVDRAKSKLMSDARLSEDEAFRWLRRRAMDSRRRLGDVAREVLGDDAALEPAGASTR